MDEPNQDWHVDEGVLRGPHAAWALDSATDAIIVIDGAGIVRAWNRACVDLFGYPRAEAIGRDVDFMIPPKLREAHHRGFTAAMERGALGSDGQARRTKALRGDGTPVYIDMTFAMLADDDGQVIGSVAVARPATERDAPTHGRKRYRGEQFDVTFDSALCNHNGQCTKNMPEVFDTSRRPWINPSVAVDEASAQQLRAVVGGCPTGALQVLEHGEPEDASAG